MKTIQLVLVVIATSVFAQPSQLCKQNLLRNPSFVDGVQIKGPGGSMPPSLIAGWTSASRDPQIGVAGGCNTPGFIAMWGNRAVGEAIQQKLAQRLVVGGRYQFSACVRYANPSAAGPVRFRIRASNGPLASYTAPGEVIGVTPNITSTEWTRISLPVWTAKAPLLDTITINPENDSNVDDGAKVSWGHIDGVCLEPVDEYVRKDGYTQQQRYDRTFNTNYILEGVNDAVPCKPAATSIVPMQKLGESLSNLLDTCIRQSCLSQTDCNTTYQYPEPIWTGYNGQQAAIVTQNELAARAIKIGSEHSEKCDKGKEEVTGYSFRTVSSGGPGHENYWVYLTVHYGICDGSGGER